MDEKIPLLKQLMKKDSKSIIENLQDIYGKEQEYLMFLYAIELNVNEEYLENKNLQDRDVIKMFKHFLDNLDKDIDFFKSDFEKNLYLNLIDALEEKSITKHELKLCFRYILWSIDNRCWLNDSQAYVKWLAYTSGCMNEKESRAYQKNVRSVCTRQGVSKEKIDAILNNDFSDIELDDKENTLIESRYFSLDDTDKLDFVLKHFQNTPYLAELYYEECMQDKNFDNAEKLCKAILDMMPGFPPMEILLGVLYKQKGDASLAKNQFEKVLKLFKQIPKGAFEGRDELEKETRKLLKEVSK